MFNWFIFIYCTWMGFETKRKGFKLNMKLKGNFEWFSQEILNWLLNNNRKMLKLNVFVKWFVIFCAISLSCKCFSIHLSRTKPSITVAFSLFWMFNSIHINILILNTNNTKICMCTMYIQVKFINPKNFPCYLQMYAFNRTIVCGGWTIVCGVMKNIT